MSSLYAPLTQTRAPLTAEDRAHRASLVRSGKTASNVVVAVAALGILWALTADAGTFVTIVLLLPCAALLALARWLRRGSAKMGDVSDKLVYTGTITGRRTTTEMFATSTDHPPAEHTKYLVSLDGVEFSVLEPLYREAASGQRVELHCFREGDPFRLVRL